MNDKDKEAFEKWRLEYISTHTGYFKMIGTDDLAQVAWQAACEYKQAELAHHIFKIEAENAKLKAIVMLASEASCYTEYEDACSQARQVLKELNKILGNSE